jgi:hypothetical protein
MNSNSQSKEIYSNANQSVKKRVEDLLKRMGLEEKIAQLGSIPIGDLREDEGRIDNFVVKNPLF